MIKFLNSRTALVQKKSLVQEQKKRTHDAGRDAQPMKKKSLGQHFLQKQSVVDHMIDKVRLTAQSSVMEIGCGDGFLTQAILQQSSCDRLWCFEIDPDWVQFVQKKIKDVRLQLTLANILELDFGVLQPHAPWTLLANLPYQITFPILFKLQEHKQLFKEGVVMVQEEVAQKIVAQTGRSCNPTSLFLQYHFDFELLEKIEPGAFLPPPKVFSRLVYFKPKPEPLISIPKIAEFWDFLRVCYRSPRQTLKNNLKTTHYEVAFLSSDILALRAQQCTFQDFLKIWTQLVACVGDSGFKVVKD